MNEEKTAAVNYIFYLQTKVELDNNYYILADVLSKININLLPITVENLKNFDRSNKKYVISIRNDLSTAYHFAQNKKVFLDSAMTANKIFLFDISSFSEIENVGKFINKNVYRYFQLPLNLKQVAMTIAVEYFKDFENKAEWPGGRRAKLPSMNNES